MGVQGDVETCELMRLLVLSLLPVVLGRLHLALSHLCEGSQDGSCTCVEVPLVGEYAAGSRNHCKHCWDVKMAADNHCCPADWKSISPQNRAAWVTIIDSG